MIGKIHFAENKKIFACCDKGLLDKSINFNGVEILISSNFYGKKKLTKKELLENIRSCDCANIFGNKICKILLDEKIIIKEQIIYIDKIAHTQIYNI